MATGIVSRLGTSPEEGIKAPCVAATTANITLFGLQTVDTVVLADNDRVIVKDQTDQTENGIYIAKIDAPWKRATDFNRSSDVATGILVIDTNRSTVYEISVAGVWTPGFTNLTFPVWTGGGDVSKVGTPVNNQVAVWTGDGTLEGASDLTWDGNAITVTSAAPRIKMFENDQVADTGLYDITATGSRFQIRTRNDADNTGVTVFQIERTGTVVDWVTFISPTVSFSANIQVDGELKLSGGTTDLSSLNIPTGVAKTVPAEGDVWKTATDIFMRVNGVSKSLIAGGFGIDANNNIISSNASAPSLTGNNNYIAGINAGSQTTIANLNLAWGQESLGHTGIGPTTGDENIALGSFALSKITSGSENFAGGVQALFWEDTGNQNVALGGFALGEQAELTVPIIGNTGVGYKAGQKNWYGSKSVFLGYAAGPTVGGTYANKLYIHNAASDTPLIGGDFAARTVDIAGVLVVGQTATNSHIHHAVDTNFLEISGGTLASGGGLRLLGGTGAGAGDWQLLTGAQNVMSYDRSSGDVRINSGPATVAAGINLAGTNQLVTIFSGLMNIGNNGGAAPLLQISGQSNSQPKVTWQQNGSDRGFIQYNELGALDEFRISTWVNAGIVIDPGNELLTIDGQINARAGTTAFASLNIPTGVAKTSPAHGDIHATATDLIARINGADVSLISGTGAGITGTPVNNQVAVWTGATTIEGDAGLTFDGTTLSAAAAAFTGTTPLTMANVNGIVFMDSTNLEDGLPTQRISWDAEAQMDFSISRGLQYVAGVAEFGSTSDGVAQFIQTVQGVDGTMRLRVQDNDGTAGAGIGTWAAEYDLFSTTGAPKHRFLIDGNLLMDITANEILINKGLKFPATQAASADVNTLDDYEEGTWTPTIQDTTFSDAEGQTYSVQAGFYTKIGRIVFINGTINITSAGSLTGASQAFIANLPFTASSATSSRSGISVIEASGLAITANTNLVGDVAVGGTFISLNVWSSTSGTSNCTVTNLATGNFSFFGHYFV